MKSLIISIKIFLLLTVLTGVIYPLVITGFAQAFFPTKANGSFIISDNHIVGSKLIGQQFDSNIYFASRPSATAYNPIPSGGSNFCLTNSKLYRTVEERKKYFLAFNSLDSLQVLPSEMLFASASGLDPHISPAAAYLQVDRIAKARNFDELQKKQLTALVKSMIEHPQLGLLGESRINVLMLNLRTDSLISR
jgi:potassium-transporting ATPase KdpC subunit